MLSPLSRAMRVVIAAWLTAGAIAHASTSQAPAAQDVTSRALDKGWRFHALKSPGHADAEAWHDASVPGVVQTDLLDNKLIPDPFYRDNEKNLQWIGLTDWQYESHIHITPAELAHRHVEIVFEGLDTFAEVSINGTSVLHADNMFRGWRVDAKPYLKAGSNDISIVFRSPVMSMLDKVKAMAIKLPTVGQIVPISEEGIPTDPYVRKAPYNYGWDWGPRFVTEGIWKPVRLETWDDLRIENVYIRQQSVNADLARLTAEVAVQSDRSMTKTITVTGSLYKSTQNSSPIVVSSTVHLDAGMNHITLPIEVIKPHRWYPLGYGAQERYQFHIQVGHAGEAFVRTGLRSIELRREEDAYGKSFEFIVNGIPVFAKGADVIPFDSFPNRVTPAKHRAILEAAAEAHMNMLREWGGGYYESDDFYDICDELGLMVWQEFMFGGAMVPGDTAFRDNVRVEAEQQVDRLRNHPSIVLWCGNNEVESGWWHWGDRKDFKKTLTADQQEYVWQSYLLLFNDVLKSVVADSSSPTPYTPSSPSANYDQEPDGDNNGDRHFWGVWHALEPIDNYNKVTPRFMSEYGFQSFPEMRTIRSFATADDLKIDSPVMISHQKNNGGNVRIQTYMRREYPEPKDFASFVYLSQVQQAEAIKTGAEHLRLSRPRTMGSLYWQLNDCWPVASWSSIDSLGHWKALQYYAKRFYADMLVVPERHDGFIDVYVVSDKLTSFHGSVETDVYDMSGKLLTRHEKSIDIPAATSMVADHLAEADLLKGINPNAAFAHVSLKVEGKTVAENSLYFVAVKDLKMEPPKIHSVFSGVPGAIKVDISSSLLARDVYLSFGDLDVSPSDNYFELLPGHSRTILLKTNASPGEVEKYMHVMSLTDAFPSKAYEAAQ